MESSTKKQIAEAARQYLLKHNMTQEALRLAAQVNGGYLSLMLAYDGTKADKITPTHWMKVAKAVGVHIDSSAWGLVQTSQFKTLITTLELARKRHESKTIIGEPGCGKTMSISLYRAQVPKNTIVITINSLITVSDILNELMARLGLPEKGSRHVRFNNVVQRLRKIKEDGGDPLIIFDEAENIESKTMKLLKGLFDGLDEYAAIVLVGTSQLVRKMNSSKKRDKDAAPQFYRRYITGLVELSEVDKSYTAFYEKMGVADKGLRKLLSQMCENYGELNAWLAPVLEEANEKDVEITEDLFRLYHNMPYGVK